MPSKDFDLIVDLMNKFFAQKKIRNSLEVFECIGISDWETWWQVEFAVFLSGHESNHEWYREEYIPVDKRKERSKYNLIADFIIRPKNHALDKYILLEFKQHKSTRTCISRMFDDILKIDRAKVSSINLRSVWAVGVHPKGNKKILRAKVEEIARKRNLELCKVYTKFISNTGFAYSIF